jgi:hypothetical protein
LVGVEMAEMAKTAKGKIAQIKRIVKKHWKIHKDECVEWNENDFSIFELIGFVQVAIGEDEDGEEEIGISFYRNAKPDEVANFIKILCDEGVPFVVYENIYPMIDSTGKFKRMLFGNDTNLQYAKDIFNSMREWFASNN